MNWIILLFSITLRYDSILHQTHLLQISSFALGIILDIFPNVESLRKQTERAELGLEKTPRKIEQQQHHPAELITLGFRCGFDIINLQTSTLLSNCNTELALKGNGEETSYKPLLTK